MRWWFALLAVVVGADALPQGQAAPPTEYVAFRVDDQRLIATVLVREATSGQVREGLSPRPAARYGYQTLRLALIAPMVARTANTEPDPGRGDPNVPPAIPTTNSSP